MSMPPSVKTVAQTMKEFTAGYNVPIVPAYRSIVMDLLTTTHLTRVDSRFTYDPIFALGMSQVFAEFFKQYPGGDSEQGKIFDALVEALDLDPAQMKLDAEATLEWAAGKDEAGLEALFTTPDTGAVGSAVTALKANKEFLYNRVFGIGLFRLLADAGVETVTSDVIKQYAGILDIREPKVQQDYDLYSESLNKLRQVEQLFKEIEIREKKKLAARLEEKAAAAAKAAEEAKAIAEGRVPAEIDETPRLETATEAGEEKVQESAEV